MLIPAIDWQALWAKRSFKATVIGMAVVVVAGGAGAAGYALWPEPAPKPPPPAETATTQESRDYLASDDFKKLPLDQRSEWMDQQWQKVAEMDEEDRRKLFENTDEKTRDRIRDNMRKMFTERMNRDVTTYHSLPASEREKFLDERIDEMESRFRRGRGMGRGPRGDRPPRREGQARSGDRGRGPEASRGDRGRGPGGPRGRRGGGGPGGRMARMPADKRAEFTVYRKALMKRRMERGMGPPGPPRR